MSTDSSKVCPTDKATLAASLKQLCAGTNAYSKAQQALEKCESPEESIGSSPIYGICGLTFSSTFCGNKVTPFIQIPTNFSNTYTGVGSGGTSAGVQIQVTSSIVQNVVFTAIITDSSGTPVTVKCLGAPTVKPGSIFFDHVNETVTIQVTIPFDNCVTTGTYFFKLCASTDNNCITCIIGIISIINDLFLIGVTTWIPGTMEINGASYGGFSDVSGPWACAETEIECPDYCTIPCVLFPDYNVYNIFLLTSIHEVGSINVTASGSCPGGASCYFGNSPPANCGIVSQTAFLTSGPVPYVLQLSTSNFSYGLCVENLESPGALSILHDLASADIALFVKAEDCTGKRMAAFVEETTVEWFHCYLSPPS